MDGHRCPPCPRPHRSGGLLTWPATPAVPPRPAPQRHPRPARWSPRPPSCSAPAAPASPPFGSLPSASPFGAASGGSRWPTSALSDAYRRHGREKCSGLHRRAKARPAPQGRGRGSTPGRPVPPRAMCCPAGEACCFRNLSPDRSHRWDQRHPNGTAGQPSSRPHGSPMLPPMGLILLVLF